MGKNMTMTRYTMMAIDLGVLNKYRMFNPYIDAVVWTER